MFKDMSKDSFLLSAGISADWPFGRGCYMSEDKEFIIWLGEEDHLRIMCMKKGEVLNEVFDRLEVAVKIVEEKIKKIDKELADSYRFTSKQMKISKRILKKLC